MNQSFLIDVSYCQIAVFSGGLKNPFNDWSDAHLNQGFAWRSESVSFRALGDGITKIQIEVSDHCELAPSTVRAIRVPFTVPVSGEIEISSISDGARTILSPGKYALTFQTRYNAEGEIECVLTFSSQSDCEAEILIADSDLVVPEKLLMTAMPA